jgi:hypothetical protein
MLQVICSIQVPLYGKGPTVTATVLRNHSFQYPLFVFDDIVLIKNLALRRLTALLVSEFFLSFFLPIYTTPMLVCQIHHSNYWKPFRSDHLLALEATAILKNQLGGRSK